MGYLLGNVIRLSLWAWPLLAWVVARYYAGAIAEGSVYYRSAITFAPILVYFLALFLSTSGLLARKYIWLSVAGAVISGGLGLLQEYQRWQPFFGQPGYDTAFILGNSDHFLLLVSVIGLLSPLMFFLVREEGVLAGLLSFTGKRTNKDAHGSARWMSLSEAKKTFSEGALVIGEAYTPSKSPSKGGSAPLLTFDGRGHLITVAGSGGGKTTSVAIPNCLSWDGALVVHDPKGELAKDCGPSRKAKGRSVAVFDPRLKSASDSINVIDWLDPSSESLISNARAVVSWLGSGEEPKGDNAIFEGQGRQLVVTALLEVVCNPNVPKEKKTLETVRQLIAHPQLEDILGQIAAKGSSFAFGVAPEYAGELSALAKSAPKTWAGVRFHASELTSWLNMPDIAPIVCGATKGTRYSMKDLLSGNLDVFVCIPLKTLDSTPAVSRLLFGGLLNTVYEAFDERGEVKERTLFLMDEMPRLGNMPLLETARDAGRGLGVTLWSIIQDLGQLQKHYGEEGMRSWLENCQVKTFFGISEYSTAEMLSKTLGKETISIQTKGHSSGDSVSGNEVFGSRQTGKSKNEQLLARELLTPDEIMQLAVDENGVPDEQIVLMRNQPPLRCGMAKYYRREKFKSLLG